MERNNVTSVRQMLEQRSTEDLRQMLDRELHTEPVNEDAIRMLMQILRERQPEVRVEMTPDLERAWEKYQRDTEKIRQESRRAQKIRTLVLRAAAAAAILAVLLMPIMPQEAGAESLWEALARWTADIVEFFGAKDNSHRIVNYEFKTENPGLQQVYDAVAELGVTDPVVPMWLPEGYELVELFQRELPSKTIIHARFMCLEQEVVISIDVYSTDISHKYQKSGTEINTYEYGGIKHLLLQNNGKTSVVWERENIECLLVGECQEDTWYRIIKSIYSTEDQ